jgi:acyl dehydratase
MQEQVRDFSIEEIHVGGRASFERSFTERDVIDFAHLSGDGNPLHIDREYARTTVFKERIVHGMLVASLCSRLVGVHLPGKRCLYLSQTLAFKKPVYIGDELLVTGVVESVSISTNIIHIRISITKKDNEVLGGVAVVQVL